MNCRRVCHLLSAYMDGELPGVEHRQVYEHLARCGECRGEYDGLLRMKRLLSGMRVRESRPEFPAQLARQVQVEAQTEARRTNGDRRPLRFGWRGGALTLAGALGAVALFVLVRPGGDNAASPKIAWQPADNSVGQLTADKPADPLASLSTMPYGASSPVGLDSSSGFGGRGLSYGQRPGEHVYFVTPREYQMLMNR